MLQCLFVCVLSRTLFIFSVCLYVVEVNEPHEGLRKTESSWPVHQINWQKSRYVYNLYYKYGRISRTVYDYCVNQKIIDASLIAKWKKPGYEKLCSTYVINPKNYKFGTVSICRVPKNSLAAGTVVEDPVTGCRGCSSGADSEENIFGNKYGQDLAGIQVAREERSAYLSNQQEDEDEEDGDEEDEDEEDEDEEDLGPVGAPDGSSGNSNTVWADDKDESEDNTNQVRKKQRQE